jgi:hypothetical protein
MAAQRKYPEELRERAVKMVQEIRERDGKGRGEISRVARQLDVCRYGRSPEPPPGGPWRGGRWARGAATGPSP